MKKGIIFLLFIMLFLITGCGKYGADDAIKDLERRINKDSYKLTGILEITSNDDTFQYDVNVAYKKDNNYRVSLINKSNNHEQIILKNKDGVYIITPSLNKSFKFQSDWPNNNSQVYLLHSILNDIKKDSKRIFTDKEGKYTFVANANYPNNPQLVKQRITFDRDLKIKTLEVLNQNDIVQMIMKFDDIEYNTVFKDNYFDLNSIIDEIEVDEEKGETQTSKIDDVIYPLYIPTGTVLTDKEKISTTSGERIILTFDGEKPFLLVEETSTISDDFDVIPTFGEPYFLVDTIGALSDKSISWSSNGIDYYIVSEVLSQQELIEVASSISTIPTIK